MTHSLPDRELLQRVLSALFSRNGSQHRPLVGLRRQSCDYVTSFPCEIVRARFEDGSKLTLFCKYAPRDSHSSYGQRGGVAYEAEVYRGVLHPSGLSTPAFYGSYVETETRTTWLFLEYVNRSMAVNKVDGLTAMKKAVRWIARFHAAQQARLQGNLQLNLSRYDAGYYLGWAQRTAEFARHWRRRLPWLVTACQRLGTELATLAGRPQTVIHGEYYPHNVLVQRGVIRPVDWETAAIATGEIDLATLTEEWPQGITRHLELEYRRARWPEGSPADFERALDLARAYVQLRWLGDEPELTRRERDFRQLFVISERLGLL